MRVRSPFPRRLGQNGDGSSIASDISDFFSTEATDLSALVSGPTPGGGYGADTSSPTGMSYVNSSGGLQTTPDPTAGQPNALQSALSSLESWWSQVSAEIGTVGMWVIGGLGAVAVIYIVSRIPRQNPRGSKRRRRRNPRRRTR